MFPYPKTFMPGLHFSDSSTLSPIPEIPNSAYLSPELSPEPFPEKISKSKKIIHATQRLKKPKKPEQALISYKLEKNLKKISKKSKKIESDQEDSLNSLNIYLRNKKEFLKIIPNGKEKLKSSFVSKSPKNSSEKPTLSRRGSLPRPTSDELILKKPLKLLEKSSLNKGKARKPIKLKNNVSGSSKEIQNIMKGLKIHLKII